MHQSYQFRHSGKPVNPQLSCATYQTQVTLTSFPVSHSSCLKKPLDLKLNWHTDYKRCNLTVATSWKYTHILSLLLALLACDTTYWVLWWYFAYCRWPERDLFSLFQVKQRDADKVDLWLTNSFLLPLTVMNASLSQKLQGVMKVCTRVMIGSLITADFLFIYAKLILKWVKHAIFHRAIPSLSSGQDLTLKCLLPPVYQVVNFSGPLTLPTGCWYILSLQLLNRAPPVNQIFTLSLDTSLGPALHIPLHFQSIPFKVKCQLWCSLVSNVELGISTQDQMQ